MAALAGVITALVSVLDTALDVPVYDGPTVTGDRPTSYVMVGSAEDESATLTFEVSSMGPGTWQDEAGEVACTIAATGGDADVTTARATALALLEQVRDAIKADRTLAGALPLNGLGLVGRASLTQLQTTEGVMAVVTFTVPYSTVLTS